MADGICDVCGVRPATVRANVTVNGRRETLELCDLDYRRLARQQRPSSPFESLFRGGLFEDFFGGSLFDELGTPPERQAAEQQAVRPARRRRGGDRAAQVERLSEHANELLQGAARTAMEFGRREVDTEHLLHALTESDVVQTILNQFKVSPEDLRRQLEQEVPRGDRTAEDTAEVR